ncbi:MAG: caspase family protein [Rikenellaceae bacterium]|nr:caspase family protein [Rikenellaceae bacterium]
MKRIIFSLFSLLIVFSAFGQKDNLKGFSRTIDLGSKTYWVSDGTLCLGYRLIAEKDRYSSVFGKFPAYGLIDGDDRLIIPCECAAIDVNYAKGCILVFRSPKGQKRLTSARYGLVDFNGHTVLPPSISVKAFNMQNPDKKVWKHYDKLPEDVKDRCIEVRKRKEALFAQKMGNPSGNTAPQQAPQAAPQPASTNVAENTNAKAPTNVAVQTTLAPTSDVDINIPMTESKANDTFVLIIANEQYSFVDNVDFALNDGRIFKEYCIKTLGIPKRQIYHYENATGGIMADGINKIVQAMNIFDKSRAIIYYCGHGIPDEHTGDAYIIPTDGKGNNVASCYPLSELYKKLSDSKAANITYFMDACFTGANKGGSMLVAARGVAREAKKETLSGNTVVFSAASGDETAMTYKDKKHGLFTYFLLKKLQESKGEVNYKDLAEYIQSNVKKESFLTNEKLQVPAIMVSDDVKNNWGKLTLK